MPMMKPSALRHLACMDSCSACRSPGELLEQHHSETLLFHRLPLADHVSVSAVQAESPRNDGSCVGLIVEGSSTVGHECCAGR